ncbi:MAG: hypothetical protein WAN10_02190 [Candidatus Acidiferrales bacterium]
MSWQELVRERILANLAGTTLSDEQKEGIVAEAITATDAGLPFGEKPGKPDEPIDPLLAQGRKDWECGGW